MNVSFNHSILLGVREFGRFDGYLYIDSGIDVQDQYDSISKLYTLFRSGPFGMVAGRVSTDSGLKEWAGCMADDEVFAGQYAVMNIDRTCNLHFQIFSDDILATYGKLMPDIFASQCTETIFPLMCAAIKKQFVVHRDVLVHHYRSVDSPSAGFDPHLIECPWRHLFRSPRSMDDIIADPEGLSAGFGYVAGGVRPDYSQFDENQFCKNDKLVGFIKNNLFLPPFALDYSQINHC